MENYSVFNPQELTRIGIVCPVCQTESIFELSSPIGAVGDRNCPGCSKQMLGAFAHNAKQHNLITLYKDVLERRPKANNKEFEIRLYFKKSADPVTL